MAKLQNKFYSLNIRENPQVYNPLQSLPSDIATTLTTQISMLHHHVATGIHQANNIRSRLKGFLKKIGFSPKITPPNQPSLKEPLKIEPPTKIKERFWTEKREFP